jgi:hypothetical protein
MDAGTRPLAALFMLFDMDGFYPAAMTPVTPFLGTFPPHTANGGSPLAPAACFVSREAHS